MLQEYPLMEKSKPNQRKHYRSNKSKQNKEQGTSSGTETSETGSWKSTILETPDKGHREFIFKPSLEHVTTS